MTVCGFSRTVYLMAATNNTNRKTNRTSRLIVVALIVATVFGARFGNGERVAEITTTANATATTVGE